MRYMYHATSMDKLVDILETGLKPGVDGVVYLCEKPFDAAKFLIVRGLKEIIVFKVKIYKKDEKKIVETFDHNTAYFKCRAYGYQGEIKPSNIEQVIKYGGS